MAEKLKANCIDHISIAVKDLKKAEEDFKRAFGWEVDGRYSDHDEKINVAYFMIGQTALEIMEDIDGTGEVARFIAEHGEGIMVLSLKVDSTAESLELLKRNGADLVDRKSRFAKELNRHFAFLHPRQCHGVLTEIIDGKY
ncbi:MAG: 4-hydroxyphenylpyruvate dioxygenase/hemolysin-like protein [Deltaproteobacteria bacterium]|nr:4-hydroxyphenylpyruvate dioxygenase/hemolysin-like protein [Deltaproteobacteria bacterium]